MLGVSLSARRAWIEMTSKQHNRRDGVSLSARRAWIEISPSITIKLKNAVALRKESVDRNCF